MKTEIIITKGWQLIKKYDFLITMQSGDVVEYLGVEYVVDCCVWDTEKDVMSILIK